MNKITSIVEFQSWYKMARGLPAFQQVIEFRNIDRSLKAQLTQLLNTINTTKRQIKKSQRTLPIYRKINEELLKEIKQERAEQANLTRQLRLERYGKPLIAYKKENNLTFDKLAVETGIPISILRHAVYTGEISRHEVIIKKFVKRLQKVVK